MEWDAGEKEGATVFIDDDNGQGLGGRQPEISSTHLGRRVWQLAEKVGVWMDDA